MMKSSVLAVTAIMLGARHGYEVQRADHADRSGGYDLYGFQLLAHALRHEDAA